MPGQTWSGLGSAHTPLEAQLILHVGHSSHGVCGSVWSSGNPGQTLVRHHQAALCHGWRRQCWDGRDHHAVSGHAEIRAPLLSASGSSGRICMSADQQDVCAAGMDVTLLSVGR